MYENGDLPKTFQRLIARRTGESFTEVAEVEEAETLSPGEGEVLIKVQFAGINGGCETFRARGEFWFARNKQQPWFALGAEGAGKVAAVGPGVEGLAVGQAVTFVGGAFSEFVVAKAATCWPVNEASPEAVTLTISGLTAAAALYGTADVQPGETLLVTAAAGATGHLAAQLGLLAGCRVIATCGGAHKAERLRRLGVHRVVDYTSEDIGTVLREEYPSGVNVIYEGVGGALHRTAFANLAPGGRMLQVGYISEYPHASKQDTPTAHSVDTAQQGQGGEAPALAAAAGGQHQEGVDAGAQLPPCSKLFWEGIKVDAPGGRTVYGQVWPSDRSKTQECKRRLFELYDQGKLQVPLALASLPGRGVAAAFPDVAVQFPQGHAQGMKVALPRQPVVGPLHPHQTCCVHLQPGTATSEGHLTPCPSACQQQRDCTPYQHRARLRHLPCRADGLFKQLAAVPRLLCMWRVLQHAMGARDLFQGVPASPFDANGGVHRGKPSPVEDVHGTV